MQRVVVGHLLTDDPEGRVLKRIVIGVMGLLLLGGGVGLARANPPPNTPPLAANHGLCTANYNGLKNGWGNHLSGVPPAFQNLLNAAELSESSDSDTKSNSTPLEARQD